MGFQINNTPKINVEFNNGVYFYFWRYYYSSVYPLPEGYKE
jgi:hypothetical protein